MIPLKTIEELISKHSLLEKELSTGEIDKKLFAEKSKEYSDLNDVIEDAKKYFSYMSGKISLLVKNTRSRYLIVYTNAVKRLFFDLK